MKHKNYDSQAKLQCRCGKTWWVAESSIPAECEACKWLTGFFVGSYIPEEPVALKKLRGKQKRPCSTQRQFLPPLALTCVDRKMARRMQQLATVRAIRAGLELRWIDPTEKLRALPRPRPIWMWDGVDAPKASVTGSPHWRQKGSGITIDREDSPMWHNIIRAIEDG